MLPVNYWCLLHFIFSESLPFMLPAFALSSDLFSSSSASPPFILLLLQLCVCGWGLARIAMLETLIPLVLPVSSFQSACIERPVCSRHASALSARGLSPSVPRMCSKHTESQKRADATTDMKLTWLSKLLVLFCFVRVWVRLSCTNVSESNSSFVLFIFCLLSSRSVASVYRFQHHLYSLMHRFSLLPIYCSLLMSFVPFFCFVVIYLHLLNAISLFHFPLSLDATCNPFHFLSLPLAST